ncbi:hypothetical protein ACU686_31215 [Yinghuangia aomiensis]
MSNDPRSDSDIAVVSTAYLPAVRREHLGETEMLIAVVDEALRQGRPQAVRTWASAARIVRLHLRRHLLLRAEPRRDGRLAADPRVARRDGRRVGDVRGVRAHGSARRRDRRRARSHFRRRPGGDLPARAGPVPPTAPRSATATRWPRCCGGLQARLSLIDGGKTTGR